MLRIQFQNVNKFFYFHHQRTLKELIQAIFKKQRTIERIHALRNVTFSVEQGEAVGIIGKNGAGKSTLLTLIAGVSTPNSGSIRVVGRIAPLIELGAGFHPELTGLENIYLNGAILGLSEKYIKSQLKAIINFSELEKKFIDMPIKHYSSGMYMRLAFSVAIFTDPEVLLVDEILAVGDVNFRKKCLDRMEDFRREGVTIIYVSHDLATIKNFCSRVLYLDKGNLLFDGNVEEGINMFHKNNI